MFSEEGYQLVAYQGNQRIPGLRSWGALGLCPSNLTVANRSDDRDVHDFSLATDRTPPP
jgi:hypothetical protein